MSTQLSEHFILEEFNCHDGTPYPEQWIESRLKPLVKDLETIRSNVGRPLIITSGYRTTAYNKKIGGALFSAHTQGLAVDFKCSNMSARDLFHIINELIIGNLIQNGGLGRYPSWVHYDHSKPRRW